MKTTKILSALVLVALFIGCGRSAEEQKKNKAEADSTGQNYVSSSAAVENTKDTTRKFIRTAELKFKVKNVINATYGIEEITRRHGGFVTYTRLTSEINNVNTTAVSADSSLETTYFTVTNAITLRVPNTKLDTTLKDISQIIDFLDYRIINADDVALQILSNKLTEKRMAKNEERIMNAIDNRGKKLNETSIAEENLLNKQEQADNAKISNLSLADQINFSTINLSIYQRPTIKRELILNNKNITAYEPGFGKRMIESFQFGWNIVAECILIMIKLWWLLLSGLIALLIYIVIRNKRRKNNVAS